MRKFLKFVHDDNVYCKYYEVFYILFHTGLRISEFCGLTIKDIDLKNRIINIDHESGLADAIKHEYERVEHILSIKETETLFRSFENMALWKPLIQRGRVKMASRDMALRDAFHYQLSEYIQPLDRDEYKKFLGAAGDELDRLMRENQDVLRRLKERD